jgi:predicted component of type VI protein secretion system
MPERLEFDLGFGRARRRRDDDEPMRLLVLGDFSGKSAADRPPLPSRPTQRVDIDSIDAVLNRLGPRLSMPAGKIEFGRLDDFHPDSLYARLDVFKALRQARADPQAGAGDLLGRLLGKPTQHTDAPVAAPASGLDALIRNIVAPHIVQDTSAQTMPYLKAVDAAIAEQMRTLLHAPSFQSLEAAWRGIQWLISSLELDENLQLHLFDVTREELLADIGLLAALGLIGSQGGAPLLAGADLALAGDDENALARWRALRRSEAAPWIGLAAPRVLLRLPYGKGTDPIEAFAFEEFAGSPAHDEFLWGSSALATALLIGRGFTARGWDMELGDEREIGDLPAYTFVRDGVREMQACAEHFLPESKLQTLLNAGLIPIASRRDRNAVVVIRFQSVSEPAAPLAW